MRPLAWREAIAGFRAIVRCRAGTAIAFEKREQSSPVGVAQKSRNCSEQNNEPNYKQLCATTSRRCFAFRWRAGSARPLTSFRRKIFRRNFSGPRTISSRTSAHTRTVFRGTPLPGHLATNRPWLRGAGQIFFRFKQRVVQYFRRRLARRPNIFIEGVAGFRARTHRRLTVGCNRCPIAMRRTSLGHSLRLDRRPHWRRTDRSARGRLRRLRLGRSCARRHRRGRRLRLQRRSRRRGRTNRMRIRLRRLCLGFSDRVFQSETLARDIGVSQRRIGCSQLIEQRLPGAIINRPSSLPGIRVERTNGALQ